MAYSNYVEQTWQDLNASYPVSAARMVFIEDGVFNAHFQPAVRAKMSANQSVATSTPTAVQFAGADDYDQAGGAASTMHDPASNNTRLTCRYAGIYHISANLEITSNATGYRQAYFRVSNVANVGGQIIAAANGQVTVFNLGVDYALNVNDYVEVFFNHNAGIGLNVIAGGVLTNSTFAMHRVG